MGGLGTSLGMNSRGTSRRRASERQPSYDNQRCRIDGMERSTVPEYVTSLTQTGTSWDLRAGCYIEVQNHFWASNCARRDTLAGDVSYQFIGSKLLNIRADCICQMIRAKPNEVRLP